MTKLQKKVYIMILRALALIVYYLAHQRDIGEFPNHGENFQRDMNDTINDLLESVK